MKYASVGQFLEQVAQRNPGQPEFLQAVTEVMESLWPFIEKNPKYADNAHIALLWGAGCLLGPLSTGAASQWLSGHALPLLMAAGAALFVWLAWRRGAFQAPAAD